VVAWLATVTRASVVQACARATPTGAAPSTSAAWTRPISVARTVSTPTWIASISLLWMSRMACRATRSKERVSQVSARRRRLVVMVSSTAQRSATLGATRLVAVAASSCLNVTVSTQHVAQTVVSRCVLYPVELYPRSLITPLPSRILMVLIIDDFLSPLGLYQNLHDSDHEPGWILLTRVVPAERMPRLRGKRR
jgi:hypothetical protein